MFDEKCLQLSRELVKAFTDCQMILLIFGCVHVQESKTINVSLENDTYNLKILG